MNTIEYKSQNIHTSHAQSTKNTKYIMNLLLVLAITLLAVIPTPEVYARTNKKPAKTSWFREKYLQQTYDDYYEYTVNRHSLEDNDIDQCPDFKKSAFIFAIMNQQIYSISKTCKIYVTKAQEPEPDLTFINYTPPELQYTKLMNVTATEVIHLIHEFTCYTLKTGMYVLSLILLCCSTLFIVIMLFCQY